MLQVDDLKSTVDFYTAILDFVCDGYEPGWGWASLHKDEVAIMLASPNQHLPYHNCFLTGSIYLRTDDAEGWWNKLKDKTEIVYPIESLEYGMREFAIRDCTGYIIQFGQAINE